MVGIGSSGDQGWLVEDAKIMLTAVYDRLALSIEGGPSEADLADLALMFTTVGQRLTSEHADEPDLPSRPAVSDEIIPVVLAGTTRMVRRSSVRCVEAKGDYARLYTTEGTYLIRVPLTHLEARWAPAGFVRIHRSFLVALSSITEVRTTASGHVVRIGTDNNALTVPVSRRYGPRLKDHLRAMRP